MHVAREGVENFIQNF